MVFLNSRSLFVIVEGKERVKVVSVEGAIMDIGRESSCEWEEYRSLF